MKFKYTEEGLNVIGNLTLEKARANLKMKGFGGQKSNRKKENTGALGKSLFYKIVTGMKGLAMSFWSAKDYGWNVEYGRDKGSKAPPASAINRWLTQKKGLKGIRDKQGRFVKRKSSIFLIQRSIKKRGIKAVPFMREAQKDSVSEIEAILGNGIADDMAVAIVEGLEPTDNFKATYKID